MERVMMMWIAFSAVVVGLWIAVKLTGFTDEVVPKYKPEHVPLSQTDTCQLPSYG
jgi:hypothetical protein